MDYNIVYLSCFFFFFQAEDGIRDIGVTGVQTCALPISLGSGGMRSKVVAAEMATAAGIPATICNGLRDGALQRGLAGEPEGTSFAPQRQRWSSFKLWLRYAKPTAGTVWVDEGAARVLRDGAASLLPVGVVDVDGGFEAGDAVEVRASDGLIGKGISNYAADELRRVAGRKSDRKSVV